MHKVTIGLAVIAVAALAPTISSAASDRASSDACVSAFAKSLTVSGDAAPAYKVIHRGDQLPSSILGYFATGYVFVLEARDSQGMVFARSRCSTNGRGSAALSPLPLEDKPPAFAAGN